MATTDGTTGDGIDALDLTTRVRRRVLPVLHRLKEPIGGYAICRQHPSEYVGTLERDLDAVRSLLADLGFEREPIASLKVHDDGRRSAGSWVRRDSPLAARQLHVTLFWTENSAVEVFAHREYSWLRHPYRHYTQDGWDSRGGVERMRSLLSARDVPYRDGRPETAASQALKLRGGVGDGMEFAVSRAGTTRLTLHGGSDTTACNEAEADLADTLATLATEGRLTDWEIVDAEVYEHPTAPFDPYTIALEFQATVTVDAVDADAAAEAGAAAIDEALAAAGVESVSYASSPTAAPV